MELLRLYGKGRHGPNRISRPTRTRPNSSRTRRASTSSRTRFPSSRGWPGRTATSSGSIAAGMTTPARQQATTTISTGPMRSIRITSTASPRAFASASSVVQTRGKTPFRFADTTASFAGICPARCRCAMQAATSPSGSARTRTSPSSARRKRAIASSSNSMTRCVHWPMRTRSSRLPRGCSANIWPQTAVPIPKSTSVPTRFA